MHRVTPPPPPGSILYNCIQYIFDNSHANSKYICKTIASRQFFLFGADHFFCYFYSFDLFLKLEIQDNNYFNGRTMCFSTLELAMKEL